MINKPAVPLLASFLLGGLTVLCFAPFEWWWLSFFTLAGLFKLLWSCNARNGFLIGFSFGLGLYLFGTSWVYISLSTYGGMPLWMGMIAVLGFASLLSLFIAAFAWLSAHFFSRDSVPRILAFAVLWPIFEWMKSWVLSGFPWLDIGNSQTPSWLFAWAPLGGLYLVSLVVAVVACCIVTLRSSHGKSLLPVIVIIMISWWLNGLQWSYAVGKSLQIGIVQANVGLETKWQAANRQSVIQSYSLLANELSQDSHLDLVVLPETALPLYLQQAEPSFWADFKPEGVALLTGILDSPSLSEGSLDKVYNAAALVCGDQTQVYRKRHLVPFGEYIPLRFLFNWVLDYLQLPMNDLSAWQGQQSLECGDTLKIGLSICYEDAFSGEYQRNLDDATLLVNISEDAWFGDSLAPHQRQQMAQMRARALARPMIRSANSGPSTFINERGQKTLETAQFSVQTVSHEVQPQAGDTPFKRWGVWIIYLCFLCFGVLLLIRRKN